MSPEAQAYKPQRGGRNCPNPKMKSAFAMKLTTDASQKNDRVQIKVWIEQCHR